MNSRWIVDMNMNDNKASKRKHRKYLYTLEKNKNFLNKSYKTSVMNKSLLIGLYY